jgi:ribonuclease P protein subunit RPR2
VVRRNKGAEKSIAHERVDRLVALAEEALRAGDAPRAHRYAELAWRLKLTYQLRGSAIEGRACRACHAFLQPGATCRVRLTEGKLSVTCLTCGHVRRRPIAPRPA